MISNTSVVVLSIVNKQGEDLCLLVPSDCVGSVSDLISDANRDFYSGTEAIKEEVLTYDVDFAMDFAKARLSKSKYADRVQVVTMKRLSI